MIEKTTAFKVGEHVYQSLEDAQMAAIGEAVWGDTVPTDAGTMIMQIVAKREQIVNILTTGPNSHPKARKANGATRKPRTPKPTSIPT